MKKTRDHRDLYNSCLSVLRSDAIQCLKFAHELLTESENTSNLEYIHKSKELIGQCHFQLGEFQKAINWYKKVEDEFEELPKIFRFLAFAHWKNGDANEPEKYFLKSIKLCRTKKMDIQLAQDYTNLGAFYLGKCDFNKSINCTEKALSIFKEQNDVQGIGFSLGNLGNAYFYLECYSKSLEYYTQAIDFARKNEDQQLLGNSFNSRAMIYQKIGDFPKAVKNILEALQIKEAMNHKLSPIYTNLGVIYQEWGDLEKAEKYYEIALKNARMEKDKLSIAKIKNNLGNVFLEKKEYEKALKCFEDSLILNEKLDDKETIIAAQTNLAIIHKEFYKNLQVAEELLLKSLELSQQLKLENSIFSISIDLAQLMLNRNEIEKAEKYLQKAEEKLPIIDAYELKSAYYQTCLDLTKAKHQFEKSIELYEKILELKNQVFSLESQKIISAMQIRFEADKKEKEAEIYRLKTIELARKNEQIKKQKEELEQALDNLKKSELKYNLVTDELHKNIGTKLIGNSNSILKITQLIAIVAKSDRTNVLIMGESGVGKEIVAHKIHQLSSRKKNSFHGINAAAIPDALFESQFFGHEKNAFTGAEKTNIGWFEAANCGTLFLDEIGTMAIEQQVKLLRVIEERKIIRVGSHLEIPVDVRLISASNMNLLELVKQGSFRHDLYHRLATFVIQIPPLRDRKEDIPLLLEHFVKFYSTQLNKKIIRIQKPVYAMLNEYHFPGNVRELKNIVERAIIVADSSTLRCSHFTIPDIDRNNDGINQLKTLAETEKKHIMQALKSTGFNQSKAAELLGVERRVISRKMKKYDLARD